MPAYVTFSILIAYEAENGKLHMMKIKRKETIYKGSHTFSKLIVEENGQELEREQFESGNAVAAIVYNTEKEIYLFVKHYRYSADTELLEVLSAVVENDDPAITIRKEIQEETGYAIDHLEHVWDFYTSPGACTEKVYLYYAEVSRKKEAGGVAEDHEHIRIEKFSFETLLRQRLFDAKTIIAVQWLANRHQAFMKSPEVRL